jgi:tetratricopeptide (TPR) repeat protein
VSKKFPLIAFIFLAAIIVSFGACKTLKGTKAENSFDKNGVRALSNSERLTFDAMYIDGCNARLKKNYAEAINFFSACRKIDPKNPAVYYELGTCYKIENVLDQAILHAKVSAEAEPTNEWYQFLLIDCYIQANQYNQALKLRETLIKNFPTRADFKEDLAIDYSRVGQYEKSYKIYEELEKIYGLNEQLTIIKPNC